MMDECATAKLLESDFQCTDHPPTPVLYTALRFITNTTLRYATLQQKIPQAAII
jgi:hypothetical protein